MPLALLALTISAFAIATTEFVIVGLVPTIANQLAISLPSAGLLVSIYALGVAVGAPVLTALTGRFPRKQLLVALMVLFTAGNVLAWQAPDYTTLVIARLLTGLAHGVFFSIGSTIATSLVPKEKAASAIAIMFGGLTVALVTGVPLGTFIGQHFGWRETFLAVSLLGVIALVTSLLLVPSLGLRASQLVAAAAVVGGVALEIFLTRKYKSKPLMVTLALTAENRSLLAKVRKAEPEFTVEREELVASSPRKLFLERTNAYNERVKQQLKEKLAEKKDA